MTSFGSSHAIARQEILLSDVSVMIYAHREDSIPDHALYAQWLSRMATRPEPFANSVLSVSGLVCIVTNGRVCAGPSTVGEVFAFIEGLSQRPNARIVGPGPDHLAVFE